MPLNSLEDLYWESLRDMYNAENQIVKALPKMIDKCESRDLKQAFEKHLKVTENQVSRLEQLFKNAGQKATGKVCKGMQGLIEEAEEHISERSNPNVRDAMLISMAQRVEHYEMAGYGCCRTWASQFGWDDQAKVLQGILDEEGDANETLTRIAEQQGVNVEAIKKAA